MKPDPILQEVLAVLMPKHFCAEDARAIDAPDNVACYTKELFTKLITDVVHRTRDATVEAALEILNNELSLAHTTISGKTSRLTSAINRIHALKTKE